MSKKIKILNFLRNNKDERYCEDCLSELLEIKPRQQVNQISRKLFNDNQIQRVKGICNKCGKGKIVVSTLDVSVSQAPKESPEKIAEPTSSVYVGTEPVLGTEDKVRNEIMKTLFEHFGDRNTWNGDGKTAEFEFKEEYGNIICSAERSLNYSLPDGYTLSHASDILITDNVKKRYVSIEIKHKSSVTDQFKCRSYDMAHLKKQFGPDILGIMIYVKADRGISIPHAQKISYPFDYFFGIQSNLRDVPTVWDELISVIRDFL